MTVWCSGRGGLCAAGGLGFESRRPRSREIYAKKAEDGWTLTGGGFHQLKKNYIFLGKNSHFFGFFFGSNFAECRHSAKALPSARQKTLGKDVFADSFFAECSLPSAALGKAFAECKLGFAECPWHSANSLSPVVLVTCTTVTMQPFALSLASLKVVVLKKRLR